MAQQRTYLLAAAAAAFTWTALSAEEAKAQVIAGWNFDARTFLPTTGSISAVSIGPYLAEVGSGSMFGVHTLTNTIFSNPAGNGSVAGLSAIGWSNQTSYWEFQISTVNYTNIIAKFDQLASTTGPRDWALQYRIGSGSFTTFTTYSIPLNSTGGAITWASASTRTESKFSFNLSGVSALNNQTSATIRLLVNSAVSYTGGSLSSTGASRIDNVSIEGTVVPEPGTAALLAAGAAVAATRKRKRK